MPHLELQWQPAAIIAVCLAVVAVVGIRTRRPRLVAAGRFGIEAALLVGLFALWQYAGACTGPAGSGMPNGCCTCRPRSACSGSSFRIRC